MRDHDLHGLLIRLARGQHDDHSVAEEAAHAIWEAEQRAEQAEAGNAEWERTYKDCQDQLAEALIRAEKAEAERDKNKCRAAYWKKRTEESRKDRDALAKDVRAMMRDQDRYDNDSLRGVEHDRLFLASRVLINRRARVVKRLEEVGGGDQCR